MYTMYTNALSYTHVHTHDSSCVVWRVHPQAHVNGKQPMLIFILLFNFYIYFSKQQNPYKVRNNHMVFGGASCFPCFSMKPSGSNNFPTYRYAKPTNLAAL